jgi:sulfur-carrier protein
MSVKIHIPTPMRQHTENQTAVEVAGTSVKTVLDELGRKYPAITGKLFDNGQVRRFVNVYLNDEDIRYLDNLDTAVKDGDELSIIPAVAGG